MGCAHSDANEELLLSVKEKTGEDRNVSFPTADQVIIPSTKAMEAILIHETLRQR
jgi:hypothetical protein